MIMIVFITDVSGFVGSHVAQELIECGHKVVGLTHSESKVEELRKAGIEPVVGDISNSSSLPRQLRR